MANQAAKVKRETIASCMTCPLCNKLLRDATTVTECLHTFCRKCIYDKISDEELERCPICNIDLGSVPLEKLRPDHNLQDVRTKIFPLRRRKVKVPEVVTAVVLPTKRKERSLSSLVVNSPNVPTRTTLTGRRTKAVARKAATLQVSSSPMPKPVKKEEDYGDDDQESPSSPETLSKVAQNKRQNSSSIESSQPEEAKNGGESSEGKLDLWKPLNCLVEVANQTKPFKCNLQNSDSKLELAKVSKNETALCKPKIKEEKCKYEVDNEKNSNGTANSKAITPKRLRRIRRKRAVALGSSSISPQSVLAAADAKQKRRIGPVWFSLVAAQEQEEDTPLPQIPANYLRIKDGNIPVSSIQKYIMKKLELSKDDEEIEIRCMGQPVVPTLQLYKVVELWLRAAPSKSQWVPAPVGSSAKDFVMVLVYGRKKLSP